MPDTVVARRGDRPLRHVLPAWLRPLGGRLYSRARPEMTMEPADRRMVIDHYRGEIEKTAELIARDLSAWLR